MQNSNWLNQMARRFLGNVLKFIALFALLGFLIATLIEEFVGG